MRNKELYGIKLGEVTGKSKEVCDKILEILEENSLVGRKNKQKTIEAFMAELEISYEEADELYNDCASALFKCLFKK